MHCNGKMRPFKYEIVYKSIQFFLMAMVYSTCSRPELKGGVSVVRELHVYGSVVPVSARDPVKFQHQGFGTLLMEEAERIAREEHGAEKIAVISGEERRGAWPKTECPVESGFFCQNLAKLSEKKIGLKDKKKSFE